MNVTAQRYLIHANLEGASIEEKQFWCELESQERAGLMTHAKWVALLDLLREIELEWFGFDPIRIGM